MIIFGFCSSECINFPQPLYWTVNMQFLSLLPSYPMKGKPAEYFGGYILWPKPMHDAVMECPVSVCHQWFRTGT